MVEYTPLDVVACSRSIVGPIEAHFSVLFLFLLRQHIYMY